MGITSFTVKALVKKIKGIFTFVTRADVATEDDLDNLIIITNSGRKFKIKEIKKRE